MKVVPDIDITVVVTFHREGPFAIPALRSLRDLVVAGGAEGAKLEIIATIDRPDEVT